MSFTVEGEYNTATVHAERDLIEDECIGQIQEMVNHEALYGDSDIAIMPDAHFGAGAVIGFTMPVKDRVVPNVVGVDCGCGMYAINMGKISVDTMEEQKLYEIDNAIRNRIPTGFDVHDRNDYHMIEDFPYTLCEQKWDSFAENTEFDLDQGEIPKFPRDTYFDDLCKRVEYDKTRAINSMGTLGGGNHFIELGYDSSNNVWCIIHSGSRGIGAEIAQHWQDEATEKTFERNALVEIPGREAKYFEGLSVGDTQTVAPSELSIDREAILEDYEGEAIEGKFGQLKSYMNAGKEDGSPLDYLEGDEAIGYIKDMIFAQTYASESRKEMASAVVDSVEHVSKDSVEVVDSIESVHNYIDFDDATIRKGACRAHEVERLVVPLNMSFGTLLCRGKGKDSWNNSSAHGAGRAMSRTAAENQFDTDDFEEQIGDVYMSKKPMDEIPGAYKDPKQIERALGDSVEVLDRVEPFLSVKAE